MADRKPGCATREAAVSNQSTGFTESFRFNVAGGVEHLLHAGPAAGTFITNDNDVTGFHPILKYVRHGVLLAFANVGCALKDKQLVVYTGGFDDTTVLGNVTEQDG